MLLKFLLLCTTVCFGACQSHLGKQDIYTINIEQTQLFPALSSGSGLAIHHSTAFIISDNQNGFYIIDTANLSPQFFPFVKADVVVTQEKDKKEDFENAAIISFNNKKQLISFGSGSVKNSREKILSINIDSPYQHNIIAAESFYDTIKKQLKIDDSLMNIEGSFNTADSLYLLNRGSNHLIAMNIDQLNRLLNSEGKTMPSFHSTKFELPFSEGFPISFSGACHYKNNQFLFTATVEKTSNWVDDGELGGSYVGMGNTNGEIIFLLPFKHGNGAMIKEKLESIDIIKEDGNSILVNVISDNDDGKTTWFQLRITKN